MLVFTLLFGFRFSVSHFLFGLIFSVSHFLIVSNTSHCYHSIIYMAGFASDVPVGGTNHIARGTKYYYSYSNYMSHVLKKD